MRKYAHRAELGIVDMSNALTANKEAIWAKLQIRKEREKIQEVLATTAMHPATSMSRLRT